MDYKERYEKALKRAEAAIELAADKDLVKGVATTIFPELCESEDERIRKSLIELVEQFMDGERKEKTLAWLERQKEEEGYEATPVESTLEYKLGFKAGKESEKQKEQKPSEWSEEDERKLQKCIKIVERWEEDYDIAYTPYSNMLKSLRPAVFQNGNTHWKPSEEQMDSLRDTIVQTKGYSYSVYLPELYEDLLKLKGGVAPMKDIDE